MRCALPRSRTIPCLSSYKAPMRPRPTPRSGIAARWNARRAFLAWCGRSRIGSLGPQGSPGEDGRALVSDGSLQRLYLHLTELHHTGAVLQGDRAARVFCILYIGCLLSVEHDDQMRTLCGDFIRIPLAGGLRHRIDLGDIDDRARTVGW